MTLSLFFLITIMSFELMSLGDGLVNLGIFGRRWKWGCLFEFFFSLFLSLFCHVRERAMFFSVQSQNTLD